MQWSLAVVQLFIVGITLASNPGWKDNTEYVYEVRGRSLTTLEDVNPQQFSGILVKAYLKLQTADDGKTLIGRIQNFEYGQLHNKLENGWQSHIPDSQLPYKSMGVSEEPFKIEMRNGLVRKLYVNPKTTNWEANIIKSILSQFQLDTKAEKLINSQLNVLPSEKDPNTGVYKTMEDTVTGISETVYDIHPLPEYILQSEPWLVSLPHLKGQGDYIEIVKTKNYTDSEERPSYHFGFHAMNYDGISEPTNNRFGHFLTRTSQTRTIVTGGLDQFTIQNSYTINKIAASPTLSDKQKGLAVSMVNVTLRDVKTSPNEPVDFSNAVPINDLVYHFDNPYESNKVYQRHLRLRRSSPNKHAEHKNSLRDTSSNEESNESVNDSDEWQQAYPKLSDAPNSPLLPLNVGYQGNSIKSKENIVKIVEKLSQEIGHEMQKPDDMPRDNTVGKYLTLTQLVRVMNVDEMKQVATSLYNKNNVDQSKWASWVSYRDAVVEAGTGPALLMLQEWISTKKMDEEEAAEALLITSHAARQPTDEYIRNFYAFITKPEIISMKYVNESGMLAFTDLLRHVYSSKIDSHNTYPVHTYGKFRTSSGEEFLKNEVIPYLTKQLNNVISRGDVDQIHLYIRALGNIGHPKILEAFETYLEGKQQCSQFQRLLMVIALDELALVQPQATQYVLYRIYQNVGESDEVRIAAVYQLMRTSPTADMLQRMAQFTNVDQSEQVKAAVQSSIETASRLEGHEFFNLRIAAQSALPLLTKERYSYQDSQNRLRSYVVRESQMSYKETHQTYASDDSFMPKGFKYSLRKRIGGVPQKVFNMNGIVSSVEELLNVLNQQTQEYREQKEQKREQNQNIKQNKWSSENIAKLLNVDEDVLEQLEGYWFMKVGSLQKLWSFDNRSIEMLPQVVRDIEKQLESGKKFQYMKMAVRNERVVSYPTEMGIPFIFTYDEPIIVNIVGKMQLKATPSISSGELLHKPEKVQWEKKIRILLSGKTSGQVSIVTPFDNQKYSAGYDKNFQVNIPFKSMGTWDVKNQQFDVELKQLDDDHDAAKTQLLHFSTWPYTSADDIFTSKPIRHIVQVTCDKREHEFGEKQTGIHLKLQMCTNAKWMDIARLTRAFQRYDPQSALLAPWLDESIEHNEFNITIDHRKTSTRKIHLRLNYIKKYETQPSQYKQNEEEIKDFDNLPLEPRERLNEFIKRSTNNINNVQSYGLDGEVEFQRHDDSNIVSYRVTGVTSKSNVDPKSRILVYGYKRTTDNQVGHLGVVISNSFPNTNGLDFDFALKFDPTSKTNVKLAWGRNYESATKVNANIKYYKSNERVEYLKQQDMAHKCREQMQQGDYQLPECAKMTAAANSLDRIDFNVQYDKMSQEGMTCVHYVYSVIRHMLYPRLQENPIPNKNNVDSDTIDVKVKYHPDFRGVNISLNSNRLQGHITNMRWDNELAREILAVHPVFHLRSRLEGQMRNLNVYRAKCVVDNTRASTFINKTYPLSTLTDNEWTVMMQYVPKRASQDQQQRQERVSEQLENEIENYVVLVRKTGPKSKDVKIVYTNPSTEQQLVEINIKQSEQIPRVTVNQEQVQYTTEQGMDYFNGKLQIYGLPNQEVKVEIMDNFYVISDGERVKLTITDGKFKNSVRGICGSFDEYSTDNESPENCILKDYQQLIASYTLLQPNGRPNKQVEDLKTAVKNGQCYQKQIKYANVISSGDFSRHHYGHRHCTIHKTRYFAENGHVCFSIRPVPICRPECNQRVTLQKSIQVFCLKKSHMTDVYQQQIDGGASPDFSLKKPTKSIGIELPIRCMP